MIDNKKIFEDVLVNGDIAASLREQFSDNIKLFDEALKKPKCGTCRKALMIMIYDDPNKELKLKAVYGEDTEIELTDPPRQPKKEVSTIKVPLEEWDEWFVGFERDHSIKNITTFLDQETRTVYCTVVYAKYRVSRG